MNTFRAISFFMITHPVLSELDICERLEMETGEGTEWGQLEFLVPTTTNPWWKASLWARLISFSLNHIDHNPSVRWQEAWSSSGEHEWTIQAGYHRPLLTSRAHILLLTEVPCWPISTFHIFSSDPWTCPQCCDASQTSYSQQGSLHAPYTVPPVVISLFCSLDQRALGSCFLLQSLPLSRFSFPNIWKPVEKSDFGIMAISYFHWSLSVSHSPYAQLISRKRTFSFLSWSRSSGKDYFRMIEDLKQGKEELTNRRSRKDGLEETTWKEKLISSQTEGQKYLDNLREILGQ